jgi:hypothetical protein
MPERFLSKGQRRNVKPGPAKKKAAARASAGIFRAVLIFGTGSCGTTCEATAAAPPQRSESLFTVRRKERSGDIAIIYPRSGRNKYFLLPAKNPEVIRKIGVVLY